MDKEDFSWSKAPKGITIRKKKEQLVLTSPTRNPAETKKHITAFPFYCMFLGILTYAFLDGGNGTTFSLVVLGLLWLFIMSLLLMVIGYFLGKAQLSIDAKTNQLTLSSGWLVFKKRQHILLKNIAHIEEEVNNNPKTNEPNILFGYTHQLLIHHRNRGVKPLAFAKLLSPVRRSYLEAALRNIVNDYQAGKPYYGSEEAGPDFSDHLVH